MLIIFVSLVSRQLSKCLLQLLRDRLVFLLLEHQIILKPVDLQVRMIYRNIGSLNRDWCVHFNLRQYRKELAKKKVVAPSSKIRKSDKLFGIFCKKIHSRVLYEKSYKIPQPGNFL